MAHSIETAAEPKPNPSVGTNQAPQRHKRIPYSVPHQRLEVPEIPGYHLHWFLEKNIPRALQGGYEFVDDFEVPVHQRGVATPGSANGSVDLGSRIRQHAGVNELSQPEYLVLMKLREEYWIEDRAEIDKAHAAKMSGIFRGEEIVNPQGAEQKGTDANLRYVKSTSTSVFNRPTRKVQNVTR